MHEHVIPSDRRLIAIANAVRVIILVGVLAALLIALARN